MPNLTSNKNGKKHWHPILYLSDRQTSVNLITSSISAITGKWSRLLIAGESVNLHNHFGTPDNAEDVHLITQLLLFNYPSQIKTSCAGPGSRMLTAA